jgi:hypothetical protein
VAEVVSRYPQHGSYPVKMFPRTVTLGRSISECVPHALHKRDGHISQMCGAGVGGRGQAADKILGKPALPPLEVAPWFDPNWQTRQRESAPKRSLLP